MNEPRDDWLWDRSGPPEPLVQRLEELLSPLAHDGRPLRPRRRRRWPLLLAAALLLLSLGWLLRPGTAAKQREVVLQPELAGTWFEAGAGGKVLQLADLATVTLEPGSRLQFLRWQPEAAAFHLQQGRLSARVAPPPRVQPRFFQIGTPAARCIDLGCQYVLAVDESGAARVRVTEGAVAFADGEREVFVPAGAESLARVGRHLGTPRFVDCEPVLRKVLDAFDALPAEPGDRRRDLAAKLCSVAAVPRDTLPLYHLLLDPEPVVRKLATEALVALVGLPEEARETKDPQVDPGLWLGYLRRFW